MTESPARVEAGLESLVARVADEFLASQKRGERPDPEEYAARYPEAADLLRKVLAALDVLGKSGGAAPAEGPAPGTLGDFRIVREVGRGGMGIVYEAEQISLGRRVALKVLPFAATMDPRHLLRFKNEARAAASLHHEHIVPVYAVGEERGVHYFAMQFIDGQTLDALMRDRRAAQATARGETLSADAAPTATAAGDPSEASPTPPPAPATAAEPRAQASTVASLAPAEYYRRVAEWGIQAAEALEHAHERGIVHRDVKPGNLMLDGAGKLWVADFGLAHTADANLTMTGDVVGTLRYMSPEQALAKHGLVDHRTDVYSLGATLYELLTLQPAVDGKDREEILNHLTLEEPSTPRSVSRTVPVDLETIILKAIAKEPTDRYSAAKELAADLRRWLEHRPIQARRPTARQRLAKWARRHRVAVGTAAAILLLAVAGLSAALWFVWQEQQRTAAEVDAKQQALDKAERRLELVTRAAEDMYTPLADGWLPKDAPARGKQREFLEKAQALYQELARETGDTPKARAACAQAIYRLGLIEAGLGRMDTAADCLRRAQALSSQLERESPNDPAHLQMQINAGKLLADALIKMRRFGEARQALPVALAAAERMVARFPDDPRGPREAADIVGLEGYALLSAGDHAGAEKSLRQAVEQLERLLKSQRPHGTTSFRLANCCSLLTTTLILRGERGPEAQRCCRRAVELWRGLVAGAPTWPDFLDGLATALQTLGSWFQPHLGEDALPTLHEALQIQEKLVARTPESPERRADLAATYLNLGNLLPMTPAKRGLDKETAIRRAVEMLGALATDHPTVARYRENYALALNNHALMMQASLQGEEYLESRTREVEVRQALVDDFPDQDKLRESLVAAREQLEGLCEYLERGIRDDIVTGIDWRFRVAIGYGQLGRRAEARVLYEEGVFWMRTHPLEHPPGLEALRARAAAALGRDRPAAAPAGIK